MATYSANVGGNLAINGLYHSVGVVFVGADSVQEAKTKLHAHGAARGLMAHTTVVTCLSLELGSPQVGGADAARRDIGYALDDFASFLAVLSERHFGVNLSNEQAWAMPRKSVERAATLHRQALL